MAENEEQVEQKNKGVAPSITIGFILALLAMGLPMIGVTVNIYLGLLIMTGAFALLVNGLWRWEKTRKWSDVSRINAIWIFALIYFSLVGFQIVSQYRKDHVKSSTVVVAAGSDIGSSSKSSGSISTSVTAAAPETKPKDAASAPASLRKKAKVTVPTTPSPSLPPVAPGSLVQSNSGGGINIQQGTTGSGSPIINSPITVGNLPKAISPQDMVTLEAYLRAAATKARVKISADQYSGAVPLPDDFYDALKGGGWAMEDNGTAHMMVFSEAGRIFQGAVVSEYGDPIPAGQRVFVDASDPVFYIGQVLESLKIPHTLTRSKTQPEGLITISFSGGFPK
jgi:hypothetical protein